MRRKHGTLFLSESSRSVALIGLDHITVLDLLIGVTGPDDLVLFVVDNRQGSEAIAWAELTAPTRGDSIITTVGGGTVSGLRGIRGSDHVFAGSRLIDAVVDAEGPGARRVVAGADALQALDGPFWAGSHHGLGVCDRCGKGCRGGGENSEDLSELHYAGLLVVIGRRGVLRLED